MDSQDHPSAPDSKNAVTVKYRDVTTGCMGVVTVPGLRASTEITLSSPTTQGAAVQIARAIRDELNAP